VARLIVEVVGQYQKDLWAKNCVGRRWFWNIHNLNSLSKLWGKRWEPQRTPSKKVPRPARAYAFETIHGMTTHTRSTPAFAPPLAVVTSLLLAVCSARAGDHAPGRRLILFFDQSASVDREQRRQWQNDANHLVSCIRDGWSASIYGIHDHTLEAAPLFEIDIPVFSSDGTSKTLAAKNAAIQRARQAALTAIEQALAKGPAARTDIFSALDRVHPDPQSRPTTIVFFSDMLNSTPELNMERAGSVTLLNIDALIPGLARHHLWRQGFLAGAEVYCVLNSIEIGRSGPAVDRRVQKVFYETLFGALSAKLVRYETSLGGVYAAH
jgi:hypothetical protein